MGFNFVGRVVEIRDNEDFVPQNDIEAFFGEVLEFIVHKMNEAISDPKHTFCQSGADAYHVLMCLMSNISLNILFPHIRRDLDYATRKEAAMDAMDTLKSLVMSSWERVELMKFEDKNAH